MFQQYSTTVEVSAWMPHRCDATPNSHAQRINFRRVRSFIPLFRFLILRLSWLFLPFDLHTSILPARDSASLPGRLLRLFSSSFSFDSLHYTVRSHTEPTSASTSLPITYHRHRVKSVELFEADVGIWYTVTLYICTLRAGVCPGNMRLQFLSDDSMGRACRHGGSEVVEQTRQ